MYTYMVYLIAIRRDQFLMEHVLPPIAEPVIYLLLARSHFPLQTVQINKRQTWHTLHCYLDRVAYLTDKQTDRRTSSTLNQVKRTWKSVKRCSQNCDGCTADPTDRSMALIGNPNSSLINARRLSHCQHI